MGKTPSHDAAATNSKLLSTATESVGRSEAEENSTTKDTTGVHVEHVGHASNTGAVIAGVAILLLLLCLTLLILYLLRWKRRTNKFEDVVRFNNQELASEPEESANNNGRRFRRWTRRTTM